MVATDGLEEPQSTDAVMSCVLLSLKVPVAVNCFVVPIAMPELLGVTSMETSVAAVTVSEAVPLTDPEDAVMVTAPEPVLVARPAALMEATFRFDEDHVTEVSCCVLPSSKLPVAINCWSVPRAIEGVAGVTEIETRLAGTTVSVAVSLKDPAVAVMVTVPSAARSERRSSDSAMAGSASDVCPSAKEVCRRVLLGAEVIQHENVVGRATRQPFTWQLSVLNTSA